MINDRLPTALMVDAVLRPLNGKGIFYYIAQKGNHDSGTILLKINGLGNGFKFVTQERDFLEDKLAWIDVMDKNDLAEDEIDASVDRAKQRDPDLWVIEIEDPQLNNPFDV